MTLPSSGGCDGGEAGGQEIHLPRRMLWCRSGEELLQVG